MNTSAKQRNMSVKIWNMLISWDWGNIVSVARECKWARVRRRRSCKHFLHTSWVVIFGVYLEEKNFGNEARVAANVVIFRNENIYIRQCYEIFSQSSLDVKESSIRWHSAHDFIWFCVLQIVDSTEYPLKWLNSRFFQIKLQKKCLLTIARHNS